MRPEVTQRDGATVNPASGEQLLANLLEQVTRRLDEGGPVDVEQLARVHPKHAERLRELMPTMRAMASWGRTPASGQPADPHAVGHSPLTGVLGDFRIVRVLGRGGMGTVFEAEQITMGRRVALKVLPFAALAHDKALQRFRNEVRAAAALEHPHIVSVYSVGEDRGIHYYSMQMINGQTLAELIWQLRQDRGPLPLPEGVRESDAAGPTFPSAANGSLPATTHDEHASIGTAVDSRHDAVRYRTAARLGIQAAEALQHAHDQGVLHRDIKPGNLMLDADGKLYVTDFGLARIEADAGLTMTGDVIGTLRYMAPEQALAKRVVIDHRADVYSLGATLYELLTLLPAFGETDRSELLKLIAFEEPQRLRKLDGHIPSELETIVSKAMAKSPEERYRTAQQLADDLLAFLENRPIKAKSPTIANRVSKWSSRHVGVVWTLLAATLAVAVVSLVSLGQVIVERARTRVAAAESEAVVDFLVNDLLAAPLDEKNQNRDLTVSEALANAESRVGNAFVDQPLVEATIRQAIAKTYLALKEPNKSEPHARRAVKLRTDLLGPVHHDTLDAIWTLTETLLAQGKIAEARAISDESLQATSQAFGRDHPDTIDAMNRAAMASLSGNGPIKPEADKAQAALRRSHAS